MSRPVAGVELRLVDDEGRRMPAGEIGNLRVKEAAQWLAQDTAVLRGFTDDEVAARGRAEGCLAWEPELWPAPVGYVCALTDPDGLALYVEALHD